VPATAATTAPLERVLRSDEVTPVIASWLVVALVAVALVVVRPPLNASNVVVALPMNG